MNKDQQKPVNKRLAALQNSISGNTSRELQARNRQDFEKAAQSPDAQKTNIPVDLIDPNPYQPRIRFDPLKIEELAKSIQEIGQIQPIAVRIMDDGRYQLIAGERRLKAVKLCEKPEILATVFEVNDKIMAEMALAENIQREDLSDYEVALAIQKNEQFFESKIKMAEHMNKARTDIYKYLAFFKLPDWILSRLENNPFLFGRRIADPLATLIISAKYAANKEAYDEAIRNSLTKLETDALTTTLFMADIERCVREISYPRRMSSEAVKSHYQVQGKKVGSFVSDVKGITIKIDQAALSDNLVNEISDFIANKLSAQKITTA
ncbi:ParB/RepB/Spo0J family partition protein [Methylobacter luteus]|uniref:ParB/RepB/Spo0J family partition protein n=1 Tax=Methylobacter luteus TaxID=415 RepID=UPI0004206190|nr:ParB/RepB/Spo0J family partition protein [Methylobacter luteus]